MGKWLEEINVSTKNEYITFHWLYGFQKTLVLRDLFIYVLYTWGSSEISYPSDPAFLIVVVLKFSLSYEGGFWRVSAFITLILQFLSTAFLPENLCHAKYKCVNSIDTLSDGLVGVEPWSAMKWKAVFDRTLCCSDFVYVLEGWVVLLRLRRLILQKLWLLARLLMVIGLFLLPRPYHGNSSG
jgi:hypothetical protein